MKKWNLIIVLTVFLIGNLSAQQKGRIDFDFSKISPQINPKLYTGIFFEFLNNNVNHPLGVCAQEIRDRGMDVYLKALDQPIYWKYYYTCDSTKCFPDSRWKEGYNYNSNYHYLMKKETPEGLAGFSQVIMIDNDCDYEFYCYLKSKTEISNVKLLLLDTLTNQTIYSGKMDSITNEWKKYTLSIPKIEYTNKVKLVIAISDTGVIEIDETSFRSTNQEYNLRKAFVDILRKTKPGVMRFPGGFFTELPETKLAGSLEELDKRPSPHYSYGNYMQRMDFGYNEYFRFCKDLNIEPYIVVNILTATPEEAAEFVSYCNDPADKGMGIERAKHGFKEPLNVKYWEIGNEIWNDDYSLAENYMRFYRAMKKADPKLELMMPGCHWRMESNIQILYDRIKDSNQIYSWHPCCFTQWENGQPSDEYIYEVLSSWGQSVAWDINKIKTLLEKHSGVNNIKQSPTEWWTSFEGYPYWLDDRLDENSSMMAAIAGMQLVHECLKNYDLVPFACRTLFIGYYRNRLNSLGKRVSYATTYAHTSGMFSNHCGTVFVPNKTEAGFFDVYESENYWPQMKDVPNLDAVTTLSADTVFISVINRSADKSIVTDINLNGWLRKKEIMVYDIAPEKYTDCNSANEPEKLKENSRKMKLKDAKYTFKPHSYTILAIPLNDIELSVEEKSGTEINIKIFPNPANEILVIDSYGKNFSNIEIYKLNGELVKTFTKSELQSNLIELNTSNFSSGVYLLKAEIDSQSISEKFTITH